MLGRSDCAEAMAVKFLSTQDGRTLLAITEQDDDMFGIMAAPVTLIAASAVTTSPSMLKNYEGSLTFHPPIFQISVEAMDGPGCHQSAFVPVQNLRTDSFLQSPVEFQMNNTNQSKDEIQGDSCFPPSNRGPVSDHGSRTVLNDGTASVETRESPCKGGPGRPKKKEQTDSFRCSVCQEEFSKQTLYRKHMENHAEEKPHRCPKCPASFNVPTNFTLHMATHNNGDPKCPECGRKFARMASLKSHMLLHEKEENLFCTECEDAFSTKTQLDAHLKLHGEKWSNEEARKCKLCNKQFIQPALYRLHIREHYRLQTRTVKQTKRGAKHKTTYKCTICLKSFQKPSQLMRHIRVHTGEKPFQCTICGRAFTQKSSLQIHTWQHNGIRPHTCDFCNAKFSQKGNLNAHITRVHSAPEGEPIYGCTYCSCIFKKLGSLNGHIKRMHTNPDEMASEMRQTSTATETDMQATVDSVITQLASLESAITSHPRISLEEKSLAPAVKSDILQEALENSGLPSKNKLPSEGTAIPRSEVVSDLETKKVEEARSTNLVTLLDKAPDGSTRKYLTIRQRCVENVRWYACSFCHKEFKKPSDLIRHLRVHTQEKPFKCTRCLRSFALKSTMLAHERTHVVAKRYNCEVCNKKFVCQSSLTAHSRLHIDSNERTPSPKLVADRKGNAEKFPSVDTTGVDGTTKNRCKGKTSKLTSEAEDIASRVVLQEPLVISDSGNRICIAQGAQERIGAYLSSANGTQDITRPHKCWVCQAAFRKISHLKQHYRRHTGERPYKCSKCDRRFTSNSVLKSHMHTHEDSRPYSCSACSSTFSTQSSMKRHLVTHSNKRPYMCPYCHKTFKTYVNCRKHMKIHRHELAQQQLEQEKAGQIEATSPQHENFPLTEGSIEITFQPQAQSEFSETFSQQEQTIGVEKDKQSLPTNALISTVVNHKLLETGLGNVGGPQMLHADETGAVTLSSYCGEQSLTPESIREIEETLNQQLLNIGVNLTLRDNYSKEPYGGSSGNTGSVKEQSVLNVICDGDKGGIETSGGNDSFPVNLDSFDMNQIALQTDGVLDIGINIGNSSSIPKQIQEQSDLPGVSLVTGCESCVTGDGADKQRRGTIFGEAMLLISQQQRATSDPIESLPVKINITAEQQHHEKCSLVASENLHSGEVGRAAIEAEETNVVTNEDPPHAKKNISRRRGSSLQCHICTEEGFSTGDLKEHLKTHRGTKEYQCAECYLKFCTNGGLSRHSKVHASEQEWKCATCCKVFSTKGQLRSHQKLIHEGKAKEVSLREKVDSEKDTLASSNVMSTVKPRTDVLGIELDSSISEKILLDTVAEREGMNSLDDTVVSMSLRKEYTNKCKYCPKTFRKPSDLIRHIRTHTGEKPYRCDHCNKSFAVKCTLDSHTKVHTGKKTFRCHVCNSLFATKGSLKVHMRLHTGSKPFRCPVCDLRFRTSGHRKVHLLKHGKEKRESPKRKQRHLKVSAIAEVAASLGQCDTSVAKVAQLGKSEHNGSGGARNIEYTNLQEIGIDGTAFTDQFTINTDGTISKNNSVLSVNDSNQLVANLHFLLANGLVTIHTEEPFLTQQSSAFDNQSVERNGPVLSVPALEENGIDTKVSSIVVLNNAADNQNVSVLEQMAIITTATTTTTTTTTTMSPTSSAATTTTTTTTTRTIGNSTTTTAAITDSCKREECPSKIGAVKGNVSSVKMCDVCGKMFTKPYQVERHKRIHTGERPYKCELCTKSFAQKSTLQMHQKHHTGDRPYPCPHCEYSFTQKGNLRTHVRRVHQIEMKDSAKLQRTKQNTDTKRLRQRSIFESKILNFDDMSFVELLK